MVFRLCSFDGTSFAVALSTCFAYAECSEQKNPSKWILYFIASIFRSAVIVAFVWIIANTVDSGARAVVHELDFFIFQSKFAAHVDGRSLPFRRHLIFTLETDDKSTAVIPYTGCQCHSRQFCGERETFLWLGVWPIDICKFNNARWYRCV